MVDLGERKLFLFMVPTAFLWAGAFIAGKVAVVEFQLYTLTFLRFLIALGITFPFMMKYEKKSWKIKIKDIPVFLLTGFFGIFLYHILFFASLKHTTAINSSLIGATNPIVTTMIAAAILGERIGLKRSFAIVLAFLGVILNASHGNFEVLRSLDFNYGDVLMAIAVVSFALYSVISKKVMNRYSPLIILNYSFLMGVIILIPFVYTEQPIMVLKDVSLKGWLSLIYMAIFASAIGYLLQQISIQSYGASKTMVFVNLVPVFSILLSIVILKEHVNWITLLSASIIICGVYLSSVFGKPKIPAAVEELTA